MSKDQIRELPGKQGPKNGAKDMTNLLLRSHKEQS